MNMKLAVTLSLVCLLSFGFLGQALAQTRVPGINPGDTLTYSIVSHWNSENASATIPSDLIYVNSTSQYKVMVSQVSGSNITATHLWGFKNGTEQPYLLTIDVESAQNYYLGGAYAPPFEGIVGANIGAGELLHPLGNDSITVNQTISRNYAGGPRDTNVVHLSDPIINSTLDSATNSTVDVTIGSQNTTYYLDKATGVLVEQNITIESFTPKESFSIIWTLKETNIWDVSPPFEWTLQNLIPAIAVIVVIVVLVSVLLYRTRRKGHKKKYR